MLVVLLLALSVFAQIDTSTLRAKYGPPLKETFLVRPGVEMVVDYGSNGQVCKMRISWVLRQAEADQIFAELVPVAARGKEVSRMTAVSGVGPPTFAEYAEYENVTITQIRSDDDVRESVATFKNAGCPIHGAK